MKIVLLAALLAISTNAHAKPGVESFQDVISAHAASEAAEEGATAYRQAYWQMYTEDPIGTLVEDAQMRARAPKPKASVKRIASAAARKPTVQNR